MATEQQQQQGLVRRPSVTARRRRIFCGLMSGTSLDGIDCVLAEFHAHDDGTELPLPPVLVSQPASLPSGVPSAVASAVNSAVPSAVSSTVPSVVPSAVPSVVASAGQSPLAVPVAAFGNHPPAAHLTTAAVATSSPSAMSTSAGSLGAADARVFVLASSLTPFPDALRAELLALQAPCDNELDRAAVASQALAQLYARCVLEQLEAAGLHAADVEAIGMHGQTVRHQPHRGFTVQLGSGALLAELTGIAVACDFRSGDVAAGGQGAPLVPAFHHWLFRHETESRVIVNLGGIANVTVLPPASHCNLPVRGWDTGPASVLLDGWIARHSGKLYDAGGQWAASGHVVPELLSALLAEPFYALAPPKSCGRDNINLEYVDRALAALGDGKKPTREDVQATLLELTAVTLVTSLAKHGLPETGASSVFVCGGGAHNTALVSRMRELLAAHGVTYVATSDELGVGVDWVEAVAFAWLARQRLARAPANLPAVTGARRLRVLGAVYEP